MGYLVKASFNAEPRAYSLERIQNDVSANLLPATALVRHEKQDFWYSVGELIGETSAAKFQFACPRCQAITQAREIDVGLEMTCQKCGAPVLIPDIQPSKDPSLDQPLLRRGNLLLFWGAVIVVANVLLNSFCGGVFGFIVIDLIGICMMINGYGKRQLYYRKHLPASQRAVPSSIG